MTIRSRHKKPGAAAAAVARSTGLRQIGFTEAKCGRTERKLKRPKQKKADVARNRVLLHAAATGDPLLWAAATRS